MSCNLMTLEEFTKTTSMTDLFRGTEIPAETIDEVYAWYQFRRVCDNKKFSAFFNRQAKLVERQYMLYLRNDMTTWDPMVADYMERQILAKETGTQNGTQTGTDTTTRTGKVTHTSGGSDVVNTEGTNGNTRTLDTTDTTDMLATAGGTDKTDRSETRTDDLTHTRDLQDVRTDNTQSDDEDAGYTSDIQDAKSLSGATPDSSTYGTGSSIGLTQPIEGAPMITHDIGAPAKLDWKYTSGQSEGITTNDHVNRGKRIVKNTGTVTTDGSGNTKDTGTVENTGDETVTYGKTMHDDGTVKQTGTIEDAGKTTGKSTTQYGRTLTDANELTDSHETSEHNEGESSKDLDHKERYSGRHEAPPALLRAAQEYIVGSNSLKWLLKQLETCFFQLYDDDDFVEVW